MVFERIDQFNAEIADAAAEQRQPVLAGDVSSAAKHVSIATQHRLMAALRAFLNYQWRRAHKLPFNPCFAVKLEPEVTPEAERWSAAEARTFIAASAADPLGLMFRIILLRGERRGEAVGFRWSGADLDAGYLTVEKTVLELGGHVIDGKPKTRTSARKVWLDDETITLLREHRRTQLADRLRAGGAWQDNDLVLCRADGTPWPPDYVSRRFKQLALAAGLRPIKLHEGRHTAASLGHDAEVDPEIRRRTLGHADKAMTSHYTHPEQAAYRAAANPKLRPVR
jgi:integrase